MAPNDESTLFYSRVFGHIAKKNQIYWLDLPLGLNLEHILSFLKISFTLNHIKTINQVSYKTKIMIVVSTHFLTTNSLVAFCSKGKLLTTISWLEIWIWKELSWVTSWVPQVGVWTSWIPNLCRRWINCWSPNGLVKMSVSWCVVEI